MLVYVGKGSFLPGIPARDLTDEEVKRHGGEKALVATGLYEPAKRPSAVKATPRPAPKSGPQKSAQED